MIARRFGDWGRDNAVYFASFAAGVLIAVSFLHLMPKSIELSAKAQCSCLLGIC
jgi:zinc transporter ZupT